MIWPSGCRRFNQPSLTGLFFVAGPCMHILPGRRHIIRGHRGHSRHPSDPQHLTSTSPLSVSGCQGSNDSLHVDAPPKIRHHIAKKNLKYWTFARGYWHPFMLYNKKKECSQLGLGTFVWSHTIHKAHIGPVSVQVIETPC